GQSTADELRLAVAPRATIHGFGSIEVGVVYVQGAGGALALPEVLVRYKRGSACEAALENIAKHGRSGRGRGPNERTIPLSPRLPTARMTAGLVVGVLRALTCEPDARRKGSPISPASRHAA